MTGSNTPRETPHWVQHWVQHTHTELYTFIAHDMIFMEHMYIHVLFEASIEDRFLNII